MLYCLFEDERVADLAPLSLTRHVSELLVGAHTLLERATQTFGDGAIRLHVRRYLRDLYSEALLELSDATSAVTFVNGRALITPGLFREFPDDGECILMSGADVVAARLGRASLTSLSWEQDALDFSGFTAIPRLQTTEATVYRFLWDLIDDNARVLELDATHGHVLGHVSGGAHLVNEGAIAIGSGSTIAPGVVLDASAGPIIIGSGVAVMANAVVVGPCSIGDNSRIKIAAKIYEKCSIGPWCKVGGEVENSILLGYANKQHDGFLGHSYLGRWVNLGADTNTSDLKNNYGSIRASLDGKEFDTGRMFLGSLVGDHAKTAINTMLNSGTVIGVMANVFGGGFPPKSIGSFAWGGFDAGSRFRLEDAVKLARTVMARRGVELGKNDETLLRYLYDHSG